MITYSGPTPICAFGREGRLGLAIAFVGFVEELRLDVETSIQAALARFFVPVFAIFRGGQDPSESSLRCPCRALHCNWLLLKSVIVRGKQHTVYVNTTSPGVPDLCDISGS